MTTTEGGLPSTRRRRVGQFLFRAGALASLVLIVGPALWLVVGVVVHAVPHWRWSVLTTSSTPAGGGLENAILGSIQLMVGVALVAGSVGVLAGIYLAGLLRRHHGGKERGAVFRTAIEVLSGFPSIVLGYVGFVALVVGLHWGLSLLPAVLILSMMVVPYIAKATEAALRQVPTSYVEGAEALGMSTGYALRKVVLRSALPGIVTGLLIALAIAGGETAPLLYTGGWTNNLPGAALTHHQVAYLTYPVWTWFNYPSNEFRYLSYDAALLLLVMVLLLLVTARIIVARTQRHAERRA